MARIYAMKQEKSPLPIPNDLYQSFDMRDRRCLPDPMTEVEYMRPTSKGFEDVMNTPFKFLSPCKQQQGIEIALDRHSRRQNA